ncbi:hypothetical protein L5515_009684 [Caenorhabditis briggsae]|uniref:YitH/HolE acetyltransferase (GNAT) domain-containing protein n=1 Tax=Caenorhabditis briggsae TaxID=6238 RepID=A0AAE9FB15_CAEBR|nr:hypothetical protein L5515_009684 [Caenorhabditis briggsae]
MPEYWHLDAEIQPGKMRIPELSDSYTTETWENVDSDQLDNYDITICPRNRKNYLKLWFQQNEVSTKVAFDSAHKIVGYCTIRVVNLNRLCAAPFYAENPEVAARLLADVPRIIPNFEKYEKLFFWYPVANRNVESMLSKFFPKEAYRIQTEFRTQFTKEMIKSTDDVVYSVACGTHQFV